MLPIRDNAPGYVVPVTNIGLIVFCCAVFGLQNLHPEGFEASLQQWGEVPARIWAGEKVPGTSFPAWITLFTSMFMHGGLGHLVGNMYALWLFGDNVEWILGRVRYLVFFVAVGFLANVVTTGLGWQSVMPGIGASGAISGVMLAYILFFPCARISTLMWIDPFSFGHLYTQRWGPQVRNISAVWYIGIWVAFQFLYSGLALYGGAFLNLGIYAHASGAAFGLLAWPIRLKERMPKDSHPTRAGHLSDALYGDEGLSGGTEIAGVNLEDDMARLRRQHGGRKRLPEPEFHDRIAEELIEQGEYQQAYAHCRDMLAIAEKQFNSLRITGYRELLARIRAAHPEVDVPRPKGRQRPWYH